MFQSGAFIVHISRVMMILGHAFEFSAYFHTVVLLFSLS